MTKLEKLQAAAEALSAPQLDALIELAQSMKGSSFYDVAPVEARASLERGIAQAETGQTVSLEELAARLQKAALPRA